MLEHEHALRAELHPVWAVRPVAFTTLEGRPALVLEDPGGEPIVQRAGKPMDVTDVLRVGAGAAAALRQLHGGGLIHKDIKPANVLMEWENGPGVVAGIRHCISIAAGAPFARAAGVHRGDARVHGAGADGLDEPVDWKVENALRKSDAMIYESNCHEGNYALANILSAARAEENKK